MWKQDRIVSGRYTVEGQKKIEIMTFDEAGEVISDFALKADAKPAARKKGAEKAFSLNDLLELIRKRLLKVIPQTAAKARISKPVYCLALAYDGESNEILPPLLGIGLESERQGWIQEHGREAKDYMWNPAEFKHYEQKNTHLKNEELEAWCVQANELLEKRGTNAPARRMLNAVAASLAKQRWKGKLKTTADFVVYAVDFELGSLQKNMKLSVPEKRFATLRKAKLL